MHKSSCRNCFCYMLIFFHSFFRLSNFIDSCIRCLFVICVVFVLSGTPINPPHSLLVRLFLDRLPCFFNGTNLSMIFSISYFRMFQHLIAVLFLSMLFQSSFAKYFPISLYLPLWKFLLYFSFVLSGFALMSKCI